MTDTTEQRVPTVRDVIASLPPVFRALVRLLSVKQLASLVLAPRYRLALWVGAVSAGKTFVSCLAFLIAVRKAPSTGTIVMIGKTLQTIESNVLSQLTDPALFGRLAGYTVHTAGASYAIVLGRRVQLIGAPNKGATDRIRGGTYCLAYVDEATLLPIETWRMLLTRLRVPGARLLATTNPGSKNHWLLKDYILNAAANDLIVFYLTMIDNPSLTKSYIVWMMRTNVGVFYQRFILGLWTNAEGAIYPHFDDRKHVIRWADMPPIARIIAAGIDHGTTNPTAVLLLGLTNEFDGNGNPAPRLVLMDELRLEPREGHPRMPPSEQADEVAKWLSMHVRHSPHDQDPMVPQLVFVDPAAAGFFEQLRATRRIRALETADNDVLEGISDMSSLLAQGRLLITDRCPKLLAEITEYSWDPKETEKHGRDMPVKLNDHSLDAARYAIRSTKPIWQAAMRAAYGLAA